MADADTARRKITPGYGSDDRPVARVLWARDAYDPNHIALTISSDYDPHRPGFNFSRYFDPEFAKAEYEKIWSKSWLFACREEDIPNIGDRVPLQVGPLSYFIVRSGEDEFKAFYNSCPHRGTMLCAKAEHAETIRCPYHAWEWNVDGRLKKIPSHWDFTEITRLNGSLAEVKLDRWGGFIFINADKDSAPLADALGIIPEHFKEFNYERRYTGARFRKLVRANWKVSQEAFHEAYHLYATHPEAVPYNGDSQTQYDVWPGKNGHVGRNASCSAEPSMHASSDADMFGAAQMFAQSMRDWHYPDGKLPELDPDQDLRTQLGAWHRSEIARFYGRSLDLPDAVMMDSFLYFMFPHTCFWLSESVPFTYQFTPHETNPELSYFDVRLMLPCPEGRPTPPSSPAIEVGPEESIYEKVPTFGILGYVFDQDMSNLPLVQRGMHAANPSHPESRLGAYQEKIIQHWNAVIDEMIQQD